MADNNSRGLSIELDVDVSNAIKGLKAVQREAKEATKALKEFEVTVTKNDGELIASVTQENAICKNGYSATIHKSEVIVPSSYRVKEHVNIIGAGVVVDDSTGTRLTTFSLDIFSTKALTEELAKREGIEEFTVSPHHGKARLCIENGVQGICTDIEGPARIIVNRD
ncbi:BC1881 family protein [Psychrobacillus sp. FSL K6-1267]|uniref:BC1881 family protein n=1 Tax=Psychrobacillus sp. FSL K6-1267 TaxID=2921543 RepID=UPI0030FA7AB4